MKINTKLAKSVSYGGKRDLSEIKYIVIHYTGNKGDTAKNNADYFATSNTREAGAHFFVDKDGEVWKSINMTRIAWAVGGCYSTSNGAGSYYQICTNSNSVSIELCDLTSGFLSWKQLKSTGKLVKYIRKKCKNADAIIRHWDVNGKSCPVTMAKSGSTDWKRLKKYLNRGYQIKGIVSAKTPIYPNATSKKQSGTVKKGKTVRIVRINDKTNRGRLKNRSAAGKWRWIDLDNIDEI